MKLLQTLQSGILNSTVPPEGTAKRPWGLRNASQGHLSPTFKLHRREAGTIGKTLINGTSINVLVNALNYGREGRSENAPTRSI